MQASMRGMTGMHKAVCLGSPLGVVGIEDGGVQR